MVGRLRSRYSSPIGYTDLNASIIRLHSLHAGFVVAPEPNYEDRIPLALSTISAGVFVCVCVCAHVYVCVHMRMYVCTNIYVCVYMCTKVPPLYECV